MLLISFDTLRYALPGKCG